MREVIGAILEDSDFIARTSAAHVSTQHREWNRLAEHPPY
jgi:hypothetical protein